MDPISSLLRQEATAHPEGTSLARLLELLGPRGPAALMLILPLPFAVPIQIPGMSIPFGLLLIVVGIQFGWREQLWCPGFVGRLQIKAKNLQALAGFTDKATAWLQRVFRRRWEPLVQDRWAHRVTGLCVVCGASVMILPIPIPGCNMLVAIPLVIMGLAMLSQDGLLLVVGWVLTLTGFVAGVCLFGFALRELKLAL